MTWNRFVYRFDFFAYPTLALFLIYASFDSLMAHPVRWATAWAIGFVVWTFAEYWVHRSLLHGPYWMGIHERHHKMPREHVVFPFWQIPAYFAAIFVAVWLVSGAYYLPVFDGIIVGWIVFFVMHHLMHHVDDLAAWPWLYDFAIRHNAHHKLTVMNYGITTDLWDRVFGTFRRRGET